MHIDGCLGAREAVSSGVRLEHYCWLDQVRCCGGNTLFSTFSIDSCSWSGFLLWCRVHGQSSRELRLRRVNEMSLNFEVDIWFQPETHDSRKLGPADNTAPTCKCREGNRAGFEDDVHHTIQ